MECVLVCPQSSLGSKFRAAECEGGDDDGLYVSSEAEHAAASAVAVTE